MRGDNANNSKIIFFLFLNENICCDPSLEPSHRDSSNEGSQNMFLWRNMANYPVIPSQLEHCLWCGTKITKYLQKLISPYAVSKPANLSKATPFASVLI